MSKQLHFIGFRQLTLVLESVTLRIMHDFDYHKFTDSGKSILIVLYDKYSRESCDIVVNRSTGRWYSSSVGDRRVVVDTSSE